MRLGQASARLTLSGTLAMGGTLAAMTESSGTVNISDDLDLIMRIGTEVEDGYLVRAKDYQAVERALNRLMERVRRLSGKRVVIAGDRIVTVYRARPSKDRCLLRQAEQRAMLG